MGEIHNLQLVIAQSNIVNRLNEGPLNGAANGSQILNVVEAKKNERKLRTVKELSESEKIEREEPKKRRIKQSSKDHLLDIYG